MGSVLTVSPVSSGTTIPFGPVVATVKLGLQIFVQNTGNAPFDLTAITITPIGGTPGGDFTFVSPTLPVTIGAGSGLTLNIAFQPTGAHNLAESATLAFTTTAGSGTSSFTMTGTSALATDTFLQITTFPIVVDPSTGAFPAVLDFNYFFGQLTAGNKYTHPFYLFVKNTTSSTITFSLTPLLVSSYSITAPSSLTLTAGQYVYFQLSIIPAPNEPNQDDLNAVVVNVASATYNVEFEAQYSTPELVPAFSLTGSLFEMLMGFLVGGVSTLLVVNNNSLAPEEPAFATRQYNLGDPWQIVQLSRLLLRYERLGPTQVQITYASQLVGGSGTVQTPVITTITLNTATDGLLKSILCDGSIAGDIIQITFTVAANAGPFSMTLFAPYFEPRGEDIEAT